MSEACADFGAYSRVPFVSGFLFESSQDMVCLTPRVLRIAYSVLHIPYWVMRGGPPDPFFIRFKTDSHRVRMFVMRRT